jgi:hypothetical protein
MSNPLGDWRSPRGVGSTVGPADAVALVVGFAAVTAAVLVAHRTPTTGYEVSIYAATPVAVWVGVGVAVACAVLVAFTTRSARAWAGALLLGGEAFVVVVGLPVIRGYEFYSAGDALSHMGWIRDVFGGDLALADLIYPGLHTVAILFHRLVGLDLDHAMLLSVVVYATVFVVFVPLVAYALTDNATAGAAGVFAAVLLLPINNISAHLVFFPSTMAVFFFPFVLLLAVVALRDASEKRLTPVDGLLGLAGLGVLFVHPQQAVNVLMVFATVSVLVGAYRYRAADPSIDPLYRHTGFLAAATVAWALQHERISETAGAYVGAVVEVFVGTETASGGAISQRTGSLSAIGASPLEIAAKLFLPGAVFAVLAGLLLAGAVVGWLRGERDRRALLVVGLGLLPVGVVMILYVLGNLQTIYFRHLGFIMALVSVFGAVAVARLVEGTADRGYDWSSVALTLVILGPLLALSVATVYPSPFIYQPNSQVTETQFSGHETAFAYENESIPYVGVRSGPDRFRDAIEGTGELGSRSVRRSSRVPFGQLGGNLTAVFDSPRYVLVSESDYQREIVAYRSLRYSERGFERLGRGQGVDRVLSNGGFRVYHVDE